MRALWRSWLGLFLLLLLHLSKLDARIQPLHHRKGTNVAAKSQRTGRTSRRNIGADGDTGAQGLRRATGLSARRRRAQQVAANMPQAEAQKRRMVRRRAGEKLALQAGEETGDIQAVVKGTKKKKKKQGGKKKMSKEEAIAAAQEAQAAAAAALLKGISHEDAAKAAEALLNEKGAGELTKGVLSAEDVEKAEGRPAPFKKKDAAAEAPAAASDAAAVPAKKKKKKKKAASAGVADASAASGADAAAVSTKESSAEAEADLTADDKPAAEPVKPAAKKKKKKGTKKAAGDASDVSDRRLLTPDPDGAHMMRQQGEEAHNHVDEEYEEDDAEGEDANDEEVEVELEMTGSAEEEEGKGDQGAATIKPSVGPGQAAPKTTIAELLAVQSEKESASSAAQEDTSPVAQEATPSAAGPPAAAAEAALSPPPAAPAATATAPAPVPAQPPAKVGRPWFPLPEKREVSLEVLASLINASAAAVRRDAAALGHHIRKHISPHHEVAAAEDAAADDAPDAEAQATPGIEKKKAAPEQKKEVVKVAAGGEEEGPALPEVKQLPPWFKDIKDRSAKIGAGQRHRSRQKALGPEEMWLRAHQRHLQEVREEYDVVFYGDDIVEAWRGTFVGQKYGPFNDIPAVWDQFFVGKGYKALAAGIAGDGVEQLHWRLKNGELPPIVPPKVIVIACGTNSKGMSGDCGVAAARESAERMRETLVFVRQALPAARVVVQALLPKGDFWPNRCTPAFDAFNTELQAFAAEHAGHVRYVDYGAAFLTKRPSNVWGTSNSSTTPVREEINEMYMPDALHPSAAGMRLIAAKLEPLISELVAEAEGAAAQQSA